MQLTLMGSLLLILIMLALLNPAEAVSGVIWDKKSGNFVPIFSIPSFAEWKDEVLKKSREQETHNFQGKPVRFTYYEITNLVNSETNGTKVSGAIGEVWNVLADHLNFTLKPILSEEKTLGIRNANDVYENGLFRVIQFNKTDVIPRVEIHRKKLRVIQFLLPFWKTKSQLYVRQEEQYESLWMLKLFSPDLWHAILWMYLLISVCSYVSEMAGRVLTRQNYEADLGDHFFYNFGMIYCDQGNILESSSVSSCIVELCLGIFSLIIRTAFGALVFNYLSHIAAAPPFDNVRTLLSRSSYNIVVLSGSLQELLIKKKVEPDFNTVYELNRYVTEQTLEGLYTTGCSRDKEYAILQAEDIKKAAGLFVCRLNPVKQSEFESYITSGVAKNFEYKKTVDLGILKLYESGIMRLLRDRWIESKNVEEEVEVGVEPINMKEVYLILCVLGVGWLMAFLIFILENIIFIYYSKRELTRHMPTRKKTKRIGILDTRRSNSLRG